MNIRLYLILSLGIILHSPLAKGQDNKAGQDSSFWEIYPHMVKKKLNLSFEQLDSMGIPYTNLPPSLKNSNHGPNQFRLRGDSLQKVDGKYSLVIESDTATINQENKLNDHPMGHSGYTGFSIKGNHLKNKHVRVEAFLKIYLPGPGYASLFYNTFPKSQGNAHPLYMGIKNIVGVTDWKKYTLEFNTDSVTNHIFFGVTIGVVNYGKVNIDKVSIYIDNQKVEYDIF